MYLQLSLSAIQEELKKKEKLLNAFKETIRDPKIEKLMELQVQWDAKVNDLKNTVKILLDREKGKIYILLDGLSC